MILIDWDAKYKEPAGAQGDKGLLSRKREITYGVKSEWVRGDSGSEERS